MIPIVTAALSQWRLIAGGLAVAAFLATAGYAKVQASAAADLRGKLAISEASLAEATAVLVRVQADHGRAVAALESAALAASQRAADAEAVNREIDNAPPTADQPFDRDLLRALRLRDAPRAHPPR